MIPKMIWIDDGKVAGSMLNIQHRIAKADIMDMRIYALEVRFYFFM